MRRVLIACTLSLLAGCLVEVETDIPNKVVFDILEPEARMVDGILYFRHGITCIAIDPSALYADEWQELDDFDQARKTPYTNEEITNCVE